MAESLEKDNSTPQINVEAVDDPSWERDRLEKLRIEYGSTWDGPNDPRDPYNWASARKISVALIFSLGSLVNIMSSTMMAPGLMQISKDLNMSSSTTQISFSIYMLGLGFAPFLIAPLSEMFGRKPIWLICNLWYLLFNTLCPVGKSSAMMIVGRFLTGAGAALGIALTGPVMADMYRAKDRGKSLALATFIPYMGPALGPIVGGLITQHVDWPWLFWVLSITDAVVVALGLVILKESYTPVLLQRHAANQRDLIVGEKATGWRKKSFQAFLSKLSAGLLRPILLLTKNPIVQLISFTMALNFGIYSLMLSTYASIWIDRYEESETISSLNYISLAVGSTIAAQGGGVLMDCIYRHLRARANGEAKPEFRVPFMIPTIVLIPAGLFWYGWSAQSGITWIMVDIGMAVFTMGSFTLSQGLLAYLLDEFEHAASANAAVRLLSYVFGFTFPIFAPAMFQHLGYGWGNSLLALVFLVLGAPIPLIFWVWGPRLRVMAKR